MKLTDEQVNDLIKENIWLHTRLKFLKYSYWVMCIAFGVTIGFLLNKIY